ncbi:oligosaccharide flippase family protein [bacterium]|nr:oligosaccharide flippase family protein [bacterium]
MVSRATVLLMLSQAIFLLSGFLINSGLARLLQPIDYGTFGLTMSILVIVELLVITGIPEAIQKFGGEQPMAMKKLIAKTLPWQIGYAVTVFVIFWLMTPHLASLFGDHSLTYYLRIASIDIVIYGLYKYFLGVQNGLHRFVHYTLLGITYSVVKLAAIIGLVWAGFSIVGALVGNVIGSLAALVLALLVTRLAKSEAEPEPNSYFSFVLQNVVYFVGLNLFFSIDLWFVKYYLSGTGVGHYVSAGVLAKLTYLLSVALSAVLLPSLARSIKLRQTSRTKELIKDSLRYVLIFLLLVNTVVVLNAEGIIVLFFGMEYLAAAPILSILIVGLSFVTMMAVINTFMIANNQMKACFVMIGSLVILDIVLNRMLVPEFGLYGAAFATAIVGFVGTVWGGLYILEEFRSLIFSFSSLRLAGVTSAVFLASTLLGFGQFDVILKSALMGSVYVLLLWITKEINTVDLRRLKESLGMTNA